ncbi:MAG TPA: D-glycero-beta-D-manno-heptose 1-phosphate adenylyltransferase [bacterium]|nr:D-glycero-beta-D-manno-heptose 1-phosphate adenylyltransferase [bacterium]HPN30483.1 D-glycero-beta-D-manno-heptose 1-phosphate adenylyltransferase [bacterium]
MNIFNYQDKFIEADNFSVLKRNSLLNKKTVFTNGCFDIIHSGHIYYLQKAAELGDILVIGLNTDASIKRIKGNERPINNQEDRAAVLSALSFVDYIIFFDEDTPLNLIKKIQPDILVKGADYKIEDIAGSKEVLEYGGLVKTIKLVEGKSTTSIINKLESKCSISIVIPALNEESNLEYSASGLIKTLESHKIKWELILIDDGSSDKTYSIMENLKNKFPERIKLIRHKINMGLGYSIREGVKHSNFEAFTWFPADGENDPEELIKYIFMLNYVDIIIPFAVNTGVRSIFRRALSSLYLIIINITFGTMFNYTNGNIIYKKKILDRLELNSDSFFFQTETLIKAVRLNSGVLFAEVPIELKERKGGTTKALKFKNFVKVCVDYIKLIFNIHIFDRFKSQ